MNTKVVGLIGTGVSLLGVQAATKGLNGIWHKATGRDAPALNDDPRDDRWTDIILFAVITGVVTTVIKTMVNRQVAEMKEKDELKREQKALGAGR